MWRSLASTDLGTMSVIDRCLVARSASRPDSFPDFQGASTLFAISDYAGSHKESSYECYSFLFLSDTGFATWDCARRRLRRAHGLGRRTFAYKKLGDERKGRLLRRFLNLAGEIDGLCASILVDRQLRRLFDGDGKEDFDAVASQWPDAKYRKSTFERVLRVAHFNCFLLAGLVQPLQNVMWITDQDAIAANHGQLRALTNIFASGLARYLVQPDGGLPFTLGHLRCGTTASDDGSLQIEDLAAIPDLVSGSLAEVWTRYSKAGIRLKQGIDIAPPTGVSSKARAVTGWMTENRRLRQLVITLEPAAPPSLFTVTVVELFGAPLLWMP